MSFPNDLAKAAIARWDTLVGGQYTAPDIPAFATLGDILNAVYLASSSPEEGRYPQFNVVVVPRDADMNKVGTNPFAFKQSRPVTVAELRRLAPASDLKKSAIWIEFRGEECAIAGLADLGTSWHRAKAGLNYAYRAPHALLVQVDRPGRMKLHQGQYLVATLTDGDLKASKGIELDLFLHESVNAGMSQLTQQFTKPKWEHPRDYNSFWFTALWNVFASIANTISLSSHGGMLVIVDPTQVEDVGILRIKYGGGFETLRTSFINFINARNKTADFYERAEQQGKKVTKGVYEAEVSLAAASEQLVEATRFVARLASCDGAIVLTRDLKLLGFGAEIRAEMKNGVGVLEVESEMTKAPVKCDIEQFGMRHRSAIKLASQCDGAVVLTISQDGPISGVWKKGECVLVKKGVALANLNMPWAGGA